MAYRRSSGRRTTTSRRRSTSYSRAPARRTTRRRSAARAPQQIKLVIEHRQENAVSRPASTEGMYVVEKAKGKAKL